jgi:hypothetical protein
MCSVIQALHTRRVPGPPRSKPSEGPGFTSPHRPVCARPAGTCPGPSQPGTRQGFARKIEVEKVASRFSMQRDFAAVGVVRIWLCLFCVFAADFAVGIAAREKYGQKGVGRGGCGITPRQPRVGVRSWRLRPRNNALVPCRPSMEFPTAGN